MKTLCTVAVTSLLWGLAAPVPAEAQNRSVRVRVQPQIAVNLNPARAMPEPTGARLYGAGLVVIAAALRRRRR